MALNGEIKPPFTLEQLVYVFRQRVDDLPGDVVSAQTSWQNDDDGLLWKNEEICGYADEAQHEMAIRKPILDRSVTPAITQIAVTAGDDEFTYDTRIQKIDRIKFVETTSGDEYVLEKKTQVWMDERYIQWDRESNNTNTGNPCYYIEYADEYKLKLWRIPEVNGTLHLTVYRLPVDRLSWTLRNKLIETQVQHQYDLLDWMMYRAYMKRDAETENTDLAEVHRRTFEMRAGPRPSAHLQTVRRREHKSNRRVRAHYV